MKILLIEDDEATAATLETALTANHYIVHTACNGETGLGLAQAYNYDLLLLDVIIPGLDGFSLCRQLRFEGYQMPILMLTAKETSSDRVLGLEAGADDYVVKPFDIPELLARIKALLRRNKDISSTLLAWEQLQLNPDTNEVTYQEKILHLTPKEYNLLELFLQHPERIFSRSNLLDRIWPLDKFSSEEAVTTQIKGLRQKLKAAGMIENIIETVYGMGYRLKKQKNKSLDAPPHQDNEARATVIAVLNQMWEKYAQTFTEQLVLFENAIAQLSTGTLDERLRQQAHAFAHQLAGSLGIYGFSDGSKVAREIEQLLDGTNLQPDTALQLKELVKLLKPTLEQSKINQTPSPVKKATDIPTTRLLIVDDDFVLAQRIKIEATAWGLQVKIATDLATARNLLASYSPQVILLDLNFPDTQENGLTLLAELTNQKPEIPVLIFTSQNELSSRVEVARMGAYRFLGKTMSPDEVVNAIQTAINRFSATNAKVMVVDDDPGVLTRVESLLASWGFQVTILQNPQQFWEVLEATTPDLLILDIEMPEYSGIELCQAVRNDPHLNNLPILFLSAHCDAATLHQIYAVGANDYLSKPMLEPELMNRVLNQLEKARLWQKLAVKED